jgi:hypothetical protein
MAIESTYINTVVKKAAGITSAALLGVSCYLPLSAQASTIPGEIILVAGQCPGGFLPADGSSVDLSKYPELTSVVLDSYGSGDMGTINLPTASSDAVAETFDYVFVDAPDMASGATSYLVKVNDERGFREVIEVSVSKKGGSKDPQAFVAYIASFEAKTGATVENYAIRTKQGISLPNGAPVAAGTEGSYWFANFCTGRNGTCKQTDRNVETLPLSSLEEGDLQGGYPVAMSNGTAGDTSEIVEGDGTAELPQDFAPFQPQYCVAVGGDTAPLVEVGLTYVQGSGEDPYAGSLEFERIDVSGYKYDELPAGCFQNGDLCLDELEAVNPGIGRPNISFRLVGENICRAKETVEVVSFEDCDTAPSTGTNGNGDTVLVTQLDSAFDMALFCDKLGGRVHSSGAFCESNDSGPKLSNGLCNKIGGGRGDGRNNQANSPICLPPESAYVTLEQTTSSLQRLSSGERINSANEECSEESCYEEPPAQCRVVTYEEQPYPGELLLSGVQIANQYFGDKADIPWGDHFEEQRERLNGSGAPDKSDFAYITKRDENGNPGFVAADLVDERTLILENRNISGLNEGNYNYRVQAQCGENGDEYNAYYDPLIRTSGKGDTSNY